MLPADVIRAAAAMIRTDGLAKGAHAEDAQGKPVPLFGGTRSGLDVDVSRAALNGNAVRYSIYGAMVVAMSRHPSNPSAFWPLLRAEAERCMVGKAKTGLHPVIWFNEHEDTTAEVAAAFLDRCATALEANLVKERG